MTPLRQRMLEDMGIRNLAENTQLSYLQQVQLAEHAQPCAKADFGGTIHRCGIPGILGCEGYTRTTEGP